ncbi:hypothetical protein BDZ97DRAFT_397541 [Flammula alnicola]|nr:hypothetical protein BDZ97DRAFT_397541 [Flammula alnicola]
MDQFSNGLHCVYDPIQPCFVPFDHDITYRHLSSQISPGWEEQRPHSYRTSHLSGSYPSSGTPLLDTHYSPDDEFSPADGSFHGTSESHSGSSERVRRPRSAFMIFRSEFSAGDKIKYTSEHDHRHISRNIAHYWNQMSEDEKRVWQLKADQEKLAHMRKYPNFKFTPSARAKKPIKRKVKRNGDDEMLRCRRVADLLLEGKEGDELVNAVKGTPFREYDPHEEDPPISQSQAEAILPGPHELYPQSGHYISRSPLLTPGKFSLCPPAVSSMTYPTALAYSSNVTPSQQVDSSFCVAPVSVETYAPTTPTNSAMQSYMMTTHSTPYPEPPGHDQSSTYSYSPDIYLPSYLTSSTYAQPSTYPDSPTESFRTSFSNLSLCPAAPQFDPYRQDTFTASL